MSVETNRLIHSFELELATPECHPTTTLWRTKVHLQNDITRVLPYLNASLKNADYDHNTKILLWNKEGRGYAFRPYEITIAPVEDREEAQVIADGVIGMVNDVWNRRHEIEPNTEGKKTPPNLLDIYRLLPGTNCKECGYPTCMAYATDLRKDKTELAKCTYLSQQAYADNRVALSGILQLIND